jgi:hypothetical protein
MRRSPSKESSDIRTAELESRVELFLDYTNPMHNACRPIYHLSAPNEDDFTDSKQMEHSNADT